MAKEVSRLLLITKARFRFQANPGANLAGKVALKFFFFFQYGKASVQIGSGAHPAPYSISNEASFPGVKAAGA